MLKLSQIRIMRGGGYRDMFVGMPCDSATACIKSSESPRGSGDAEGVGGLYTLLAAVIKIFVNYFVCFIYKLFFE
jgi:hypothetical protein